MEDTPKEFAEYPVSVTEKIAEREADGSKWTPRDACISMLRDIDEDTRPVDNLFICYTYTEPDGARKYGFKNATKDCLSAVGLLEILKADFING